jgi:TonB family protein
LTREENIFRFTLLGSLGAHFLLITLILALPGGGPSEEIAIYTVRIMEAPAQPQARELSLSTEAISALKLESPTLSPDLRPIPEAESADIPPGETFPRELPVPQAASREAPAALAPPLPGALPDAGSLRAPGPPPSALPQLPGLPAPAAPAPRAPSAAPSTREPIALAPPPLTGEEPRRLSPEEQLRGKVRTLDLQVEMAPPVAPGTTTPRPVGRERNLLSLRVYTNRVREAVKEQYTFPGGFPATLRTRVRVELHRDGTVGKAEILESSGNDRFDSLVCLAAIDKAKIPAIPPEIEEETLTLHFTCSP